MSRPNPIASAVCLSIGLLLANHWLQFQFCFPIFASLLVLSLCLLNPSPVRQCTVAICLGGALLSLAMWQQQLLERDSIHQVDDRDLEMLEGEISGMPIQLSGRQEFRLQTGSAAVWVSLYQGQRQSIPSLQPGARIRILARLKTPVGLRGIGTMDRRKRMMARGIDLIASASADDVLFLGRTFSWWSIPVAMHRWSVAQIAAGTGPDDGRAIVAALTTGERSLMSPELTTAVRSAGVAHLLAVSGMHLGAVVVLVFFVVVRVWTRLPWYQFCSPNAVAASFALGGALLFTAMTGARPSTMRAFLVAFAVLGGMMFDRRIRPIHALAWTGIALLLWRPVLLWDVGFQLSFAATLTLALAFDKERTQEQFAIQLDVPSRFQRGIQVVLSLCKASFWATLATTPIALYHFGEVSWFGLFSNLLAVPVTTLVLLPVSLAGLLLCPLWELGGTLCLELAIQIAGLLARACFWIESWVPVQRSAPLSALEMLCWAAVVYTLLNYKGSRGVRWGRGWTMALACSGLLLFVSRTYSWGTDALRITFVEIGQGDAAVLELPDGRVWLVDGGGLPFVAPGAYSEETRQRLAESPARQALLPFLRHRRISQIDLAIVSHPHPDHYVGLQAVARVLPIVELWSVHNTRVEPGPFEQWLDVLRSSGTRILAPKVGLAKRAGDVAIHVLWPRYTEVPGTTQAMPDPILSVNDNSLVVRVDYAGRRILFAGDIEAEAEELLLAAQPGEIRADIVKVPHHGSPTSSTETFVAMTHPTLAVISCGRMNRFNFPSPAVEARWNRRAQLVLRTDQVGTVSVRIAGDGEMQVSAVEPF